MNQTFKLLQKGRALSRLEKAIKAYKGRTEEVLVKRQRQYDDVKAQGIEIPEGRYGTDVIERFEQELRYKTLQKNDDGRYTIFNHAVKVLPEDLRDQGFLGGVSLWWVFANCGVDKMVEQYEGHSIEDINTLAEQIKQKAFSTTLDVYEKESEGGKLSLRHAFRQCCGLVMDKEVDIVLKNMKPVADTYFMALEPEAREAWESWEEEIGKPGLSQRWWPKPA